MSFINDLDSQPRKYKKKSKKCELDSDDEIINLNDFSEESTQNEKFDLCFQHKKLEYIDGYPIEETIIQKEGDQTNVESLRTVDLERKSLIELDSLSRHLFDELFYDNEKFSFLTNFFYKLRIRKMNRVFDPDKSIIIDCKDSYPPSELEIEKLFSNGKFYFI
jgi:hypothetical protein